ncbi:DUF819 domain-containing protein [Sanyastnella coralliicola]|uniref:DUF819 family protein n=1 Tax=Sanyastnella coralliicola TaxID=3069118 RepID=UPI0027BA8B08|nr:DUF819 family protein [Longitalea sp. SCSIO 12813]
MIFSAIITNDAIVLGLLLATLALIFYTSNHPSTKAFYKYIPSLLLCYFIPAFYNSFGLVDSTQSELYYVASRYLLPASLVLLCLSIDLKAIVNLGSKAVIMFFTATIGIVIGGPVALWLVSKIDGNILQAEVQNEMVISKENYDRINLTSGNTITQGDIFIWTNANAEEIKIQVDSLYSSSYSEATDSYTAVAGFVAIQVESQDTTYLPTIPAHATMTNMNSEFWRGLSTLAGSWIGGGANQTALKEISDTPDTQFSAMVIVDVFVANIWMAFLLIGAGMSIALDRRLKADNSAIEALKKKVEDYQASISRVPTFTDISIILAFAFGGVAIAHAWAGWAGPGLESYFNEIKASDPDSIVVYLSSLGSKFFWIIIISTIVGIILSFTKARNYEGAGASRIGSILLYVLVATIGMKMNIIELIDNWTKYCAVILIGILWMLVHITVLLVVAKIIKAPFFFVAVGSQANVGGAASAPIVASAFSPALAPVGVLLAVLGYAVGTVAAILCMELMHSIYL